MRPSRPGQAAQADSGAAHRRGCLRAQAAKINRGADVVIATPGRLLDHMERGGLLLTGIEMLVIDEADRMLDMGFIPDIEKICKLLPFTRQTLFFSATMPPEIHRLTTQFLHNPVRIEASAPAPRPSTIEQRLVKVPHDARRSAMRCACCCVPRPR